LLVAWALLLAVWVISNAPFAAPDEVEHFIRAVGVSEGHLIGQKDPGALTGGATPRQRAWTAQAARLVSLPGGLNPEAFTCELGPEELDAACQNAADREPPATTIVTAVGNYQPLPYVLPAVALSMGHSVTSALRLARAAQALLALGLLVIAVLAIYDRRHPLLSLLGVMLAVTPMVIFCAASLNGSGVEITAAVAFFACLLRAARESAIPASVLAMTALSGIALALSRSSGPAWLLLLALIACVWSKPRAFAHKWTARWSDRTATGAIAVALVLNRLWEAAYGSRTPLDISQLHAGLVAGAHAWWKAMPNVVGTFGYVDVKLPLAATLTWFALVLALCAVAMWVSRRAERVLLGCVLALALGGPALFYAIVIRPTGFGLQGRHVLGILVAVPLLAGEALHRHRDRVRAPLTRRLSACVAVLVALIQALAWYVNAKRYAVGAKGPAWFLDRAAWSPPLGWWPWLAVTIVATLCVLASARDGRRTESGTPLRTPSTGTRAA
jgi:hypothetical protein